MKGKVIIPIIIGILILSTVAAYSFLSEDGDVRQQFAEHISDENVNLVSFDGYSKLFNTFIDNKDIVNVSQEGIVEVDTMYF